MRASTRAPALRTSEPQYSQRRHFTLLPSRSLQLSFYRTATALPVLFLLSRRVEPQAPLLPERRHAAAVLCFSALAIAGQQTLLLYGLRLSESYVLGVVLTNLNSVFTTLIGVCLGKEKLSAGNVLGVLLAVGGTIVMGVQPSSYPWSSSPAPPPPSPPTLPSDKAPHEARLQLGLGVVFLILSPLCWAISLFVQKPLLTHYKAPVTLTFWSFAAGTVLNGIIAAALTATSGASLWALNVTDIVFLVWAATLGGAAKFTLLSWLNSFMDATLLCVLDTVGHAAGVFIGAAVLHEKLYLRYLAAIAVFAGALLVSLNSDWGHGAHKRVREMKAEADAAALDACDASDEEAGERGDQKPPRRGEEEQAGDLRAPLVREGEEEL